MSKFKHVAWTGVLIGLVLVIGGGLFIVRPFDQQFTDRYTTFRVGGRWGHNITAPRENRITPLQSRLIGLSLLGIGAALVYVSARKWD